MSKGKIPNGCNDVRKQTRARANPDGMISIPIRMNQLIDIEAAKEFMKETLEKVEKTELMAIAESLETKSEIFNQAFGTENLKQLSNEELENIFKSIFTIKRKFKVLFENYSHEDFRKSIEKLLYGPAKIEIRFREFLLSHEKLEMPLRCELAGEILHFTFPDRHWLWSRWMWDPKAKTGALPLVTTEGFDLPDDNYGEMYLKVGKAVAFVNSVAESAEFQFISRSLFGTDVFLSCVYVIYAYTVLRMRMTQEFNSVMPGLTEFSRRLLGVLEPEKMFVKK